MSRKQARSAVVAALAAGILGIATAGASAQSCTGQLVSVVAPASVPFGANIVAPTAKAVDNFGQQVIVPEATAPHDDCPSM
jgi:type IV secretory pathway protease TraF